MLDHEFEDAVQLVAIDCNVQPAAVRFITSEIIRCGEAMDPVSCADFCWRLHDQSVIEFSSGAVDQWRHWGVRSTSDIGDIVFSMVDHNLMCLSPGDSREQFDKVFDFDEEFHTLRVKPPPSSSFQISIAWLFGVTFFTAICVQGAAKRGFDGVLQSLGGAYSIALGLSCLCIAFRPKEQMPVLMSIIGTVALVIGLLAFFF